MIHTFAQSADCGGCEEREMNLLKATVAVFAAIAFYVLSIGPVARYVAPHFKTRIEIVYSPLGWLYHNTALKGPLEWYLELWGVK